MAVIRLVIGTLCRELKNNGSAPKSYAAIYQRAKKCGFYPSLLFSSFSAVVNLFFLYNVIYDMRKGD